MLSPFIESFHADDFMSTAISLAIAFALGTLIGGERQYRNRTAGLRTNVLVATGACQFVDLAMHLTGPAGAVQVIAYVVSGIGFLGAGVIMKEGPNVRGLNTAATLWCSAAVGACAAVDLAAQAALLTLFVLICNTLLEPLIGGLGRLTRSGQTAEALHDISIVADTSSAPEARNRLVAALEAARLPVDDIATVDRTDGRSEVRATLVNIPVRSTELGAVVEQARRMPGVVSAAWSRRSAD